MPRYVYTAEGEAHAREFGLEERREGTVATFGNAQVEGQIAKAWLEKGYIRETNDVETFEFPGAICLNALALEASQNEERYNREKEGFNANNKKRQKR